jgi:hypothetical protein
MLDFGEQIHDGATLPCVGTREIADIEALRNVFIAGQRAMWQLAISPYTYSEIARTRQRERLQHLHMWFQELWQYWRSTIEHSNDLPDFIEAEDIRVRMLMSDYLSCLPDVADRVLICDVLVYRCDLFCTRDWTTILKHRAALAGLPIEIVTPPEWWERIRPCAGLWT